MRVLLASLAIWILFALAACTFSRTLTRDELAAYEGYALNELSQSVVEELEPEEITKACDEAGSSESPYFRDKVAFAFDHVSVARSVHKPGQVYPKMNKVFEDLREAIWSEDGEHLAKSMEEVVSAFGGSRIAQESAITLRNKMLEEMIQEIKGPYKTVKSAAAVPGGLESIVLLPEQQRDIRTISPTEVVLLKYIQLGQLPVPIRPGERPGSALSGEQLVAMGAYRPLPGIDIVAQPVALLTWAQEIRIRAVAKETAVAQGLARELQKPQPDCLVHLRASVASLLQKSPQGQAAIRKRATFYLALDGWHWGTEGEEATALSSRLIGPISRQGYELGRYHNTTRRSFGLLPHGYLDPGTLDAYGSGIHSDATGRPFILQPQFGGLGFPDPTLQFKPNAYGLGTGMDQYGRPVQPRCAPGWAGPC